MVYLEQRYKGCFGSFPHCKQHGRLFEGGPWTNGLSIRTYSPAWISLDAIKCLKKLHDILKKIEIELNSSSIIFNV